MDIQGAVDNYASAMQHCDNLIAVHRAGRDGSRGRLVVEPSVNRGTIVLAVASWQAFIQDAAAALRDEALVELRAVPGTHRLLAGAMNQWEHDFEVALQKFATPDSHKSRELLKRVGFDPRPSWTWSQNGGRGKTSVVVEPKHVDEVIRQWLQVRHAVAHGHATIHSYPVLGAVRDPQSSPSAKAAPTLRLSDAIDCVRFFRSIVRLTADSAATHLHQPVPKWAKTPRPALGLNISHL
ncbi:hypothetical protein [Kitasatospora sp. NPDC002040]|uniref:hypothetical protein n=1 Tax=Kitasatospora sp. NPDC002040 TaxID=3154661 RepID=UPI0033294A31